MAVTAVACHVSMLYPGQVAVELLGSAGLRLARPKIIGLVVISMGAVLVYMGPMQNRDQRLRMWQGGQLCCSCTVLASTDLWAELLETSWSWHSSAADHQSRHVQKSSLHQTVVLCKILLLLALLKTVFSTWLQVMGASEVSEGVEQQEEDGEESEADFMRGMFAE